MNCVSVAQWLGRRTSDPAVMGCIVEDGSNQRRGLLLGGRV